MFHDYALHVGRYQPTLVYKATRNVDNAVMQMCLFYPHFLINVDSYCVRWFVTRYSELFHLGTYCFNISYKQVISQCKQTNTVYRASLMKIFDDTKSLENIDIVITNCLYYSEFLAMSEHIGTSEHNLGT